MAGTAGIHVAMGDTVVAASMTNGGRIHNEALFDELRKPEAERDQAVLQRLMDEDDYTTQKAEEFESVCALFGVTDVRVLPFADGPFHNTPDAVRAVEDLIYDVRPDVLITQYPAPLPPPSARARAALCPALPRQPRFDSRLTRCVRSPYADGWQGSQHGMAFQGHDDHMETAKVVIEAQNNCGRPDYEQQRQPHTVAVTYYPSVYFNWDQIDLYVDISCAEPPLRESCCV